MAAVNRLAATNGTHATEPTDRPELSRTDRELVQQVEDAAYRAVWAVLDSEPEFRANEVAQIGNAAGQAAANALRAMLK